MKNKILEKYFGVIFEDYKKSNRINLFYTLIYEIRRIILIICGLFLKKYKYEGVQIIIILSLSFLSSIFTIMVKA